MGQPLLRQQPCDALQRNPFYNNTNARKVPSWNSPCTRPRLLPGLTMVCSIDDCLARRCYFAFARRRTNEADENFVQAALTAKWSSCVRPKTIGASFLGEDEVQGEMGGRPIQIGLKLCLFWLSILCFLNRAGRRERNGLVEVDGCCEIEDSYIYIVI